MIMVLRKLKRPIKAMNKVLREINQKIPKKIRHKTHNNPAMSKMAKKLQKIKQGQEKELEM